MKSLTGTKSVFNISDIPGNVLIATNFLETIYTLTERWGQNVAEKLKERELGDNRKRQIKES